MDVDATFFYKDEEYQIVDDGARLPMFLSELPVNQLRCDHIVAAFKLSDGIGVIPGWLKKFVKNPNKTYEPVPQELLEQMQKITKECEKHGSPRNREAAKVVHVPVPREASAMVARPTISYRPHNLEDNSSANHNPRGRGALYQWAIGMVQDALKTRDPSLTRALDWCDNPVAIEGKSPDWLKGVRDAFYMLLTPENVGLLEALPESKDPLVLRYRAHMDTRPPRPPPLQPPTGTRLVVTKRS